MEGSSNFLCLRLYIERNPADLGSFSEIDFGLVLEALTLSEPSHRDLEPVLNDQSRLSTRLEHVATLNPFGVHLGCVFEANMPLFTVIMRLTPPLVLAESMDNDSGSAELSSMRQQAKKLLETIARSGESSAVYTSGNYYFIHITENDVCYLTLCDSSYPKKLAYSFLEELKKEFDVQHGAEVAKTKRPFAFELFGTSPPHFNLIVIFRF